MAGAEPGRGGQHRCWPAGPPPLHMSRAHVRVMPFS